MTLIHISIVVSILTALGLSILLFFYSQKSYTRERAEWMHLLRSGGAQHMLSVFNLIAGGAYTTDLFLPGDHLGVAALLLWTMALSLLLYNAIAEGTTVRKVFRVSWPRLAFASPGSVYRLVAISLLALGIIPLGVFEVLQPSPIRFSFLNLIILGLWALCAAGLSFSLRARNHSKFLSHRSDTIEEVIDQEGDILVTRAYGYLINRILEKTGLSSKVVQEAIVEFLEHNPVLFQGCALGPKGRVNFKPALKNISRIEENSRIRQICLMFAALCTRILDLHSAMTSPDSSEKVLLECFHEMQNTYRRSPLLIEILRSLPEGFLEEERLVLLSKEELETRVRGRTRELERAKDDQEILLEELRVAEANLRRVITKNADSIVIVDENNRVQFVNPAAEQLFGQKSEEWLGKDFEFPVKSDEPTEIEIQGCDDKMSVAEIRVVDIEWEEQGARLASVRDITDRKQTEMALRQSRKEIRKSNARLSRTLSELERTQAQIIQEERLRALGQLVSGVAHDFNNALAPIFGYVELLLAMPDIAKNPQKLKKYLENIQVSSKDASNIVHRLVQFYRKRDEVESFQNVNLVGLVEQTIDLTQPKWKNQALGKGVTINVTTDLEPVPSIKANETELREALTNLIFNAVDAIEDHFGTINIRVYEDEGYNVLQIRDSGAGMTEETKRKCLEPFYSTKKEKGTGLGLSMVYGTAKRHKGVIEIESELAKGTTIKLKIPVLKYEAAEAGENIIAPLEKSLKILVVDDEPIIRELLMECLSLDNHSVELANDGVEGLKSFRSGNFDLVITDLAMPEMNGDQLASAVKRERPDVPIIMVSGFANLMDAGTSSTNVDLVISKPFTRNDIRRAMTGVFSAS